MVHAGGRPSEYTQEIANIICDRLSDGKSLKSICEMEDMPSKVTVYNWLDSNKEFLNKYTRAKEDSSDALADDIQDIADKVLDGTYSPNAARVAMDGKKWIAAKLKPKKYGDKLDVTTNGESVISPYSSLNADELRKLASK